MKAEDKEFILETRNSDEAVDSVHSCIPIDRLENCVVTDWLDTVYFSITRQKLEEVKQIQRFFIIDDVEYDVKFLDGTHLLPPEIQEMATKNGWFCPALVIDQLDNRTLIVSIGIFYRDIAKFVISNGLPILCGDHAEIVIYVFSVIEGAEYYCYNGSHQVYGHAGSRGFPNCAVYQNGGRISSIDYYNKNGVKCLIDTLKRD